MAAAPNVPVRRIDGEGGERAGELLLVEGGRLQIKVGGITSRVRHRDDSTPDVDIDREAYTFTTGRSTYAFDADAMDDVDELLRRAQSGAPRQTRRDVRPRTMSTSASVQPAHILERNSDLLTALSTMLAWVGGFALVVAALVVVNAEAPLALVGVLVGALQLGLLVVGARVLAEIGRTMASSTQRSSR